MLPLKSADECKFKWLSLQKANLQLYPWQQREDALLQAIVNRFWSF